MTKIVHYGFNLDCQFSGFEALRIFVVAFPSILFRKGLEIFDNIDVGDRSWKRNLSVTSIRSLVPITVPSIRLIPDLFLIIIQSSDLHESKLFKAKLSLRISFLF